ncbi:Ion transport 2 [Cynara cardunculus var. scolymus]|uniref:Ion transport 2 n=1 Tax=Cynara cardunculus var. scolymus TaxID=59895 RepID=A0A103XYK0_CYNCS|nr:Ion transport 2 [Cynara cardunculus var. scolymus]
MASNDGKQDSSTKAETPFDLIHTVWYLFIGTIICLAYIGVAGICFYFVIHQFSGSKINSVLDTFYVTVVLLTSNGYKDLTPDSDIAILFATFFAFTGVVVFGALMSLGAKIFLDSQLNLRMILEKLKKDPELSYLRVAKIKWKEPVVLLAVHMAGGIVFLVSIGNMNFFRALYCVSSTITTVLSDEECFSIKDRRIFALDALRFYGGMDSKKQMDVSEKEFKRKSCNCMQPSDDLDADGHMREEEFILLFAKEIEKLCKIGMEANINEKLVRHQISGQEKTNSFLDTVYFAIITMTSAGYGDLHPNEGLFALTLALLFALLGMFLFGLLLSIGSTFLANQLELRRRDIKSGDDRNTDTAKELKRKLIKRKGKRVAVYFVVVMVIGTVIMILTEDLHFVRAVYCISITITSACTEKCFSTKMGRSFAMVLLLVGAIYKNYVLFTMTDVYIEIRQRLSIQKEPPDEESKPAEPKAPKPKARKSKLPKSAAPKPEAPKPVAEPKAEMSKPAAPT